MKTWEVAEGRKRRSTTSRVELTTVYGILTYVLCVPLRAVCMSIATVFEFVHERRPAAFRDSFPRR